MNNRYNDKSRLKLALIDGIQYKLNIQNGHHNISEYILDKLNNLPRSNKYTITQDESYSEQKQDVVYDTEYSDVTTKLLSSKDNKLDIYQAVAKYMADKDIYGENTVNRDNLHKVVAKTELEDCKRDGAGLIISCTSRYDTEKIKKKIGDIIQKSSHYLDIEPDSPQNIKHLKSAVSSYISRLTFFDGGNPKALYITNRESYEELLKIQINKT